MLSGDGALGGGASLCWGAALFFIIISDVEKKSRDVGVGGTDSKGQDKSCWICGLKKVGAIISREKGVAILNVIGRWDFK